MFDLVRERRLHFCLGVWCMIFLIRRVMQNSVFWLFSLKSTKFYVAQWHYITLCIITKNMLWFIVTEFIYTYKYFLHSSFIGKKFESHRIFYLSWFKIIQNLKDNIKVHFTDYTDIGSKNNIYHPLLVKRKIKWQPLVNPWKQVCTAQCIFVWLLS